MPRSSCSALHLRKRTLTSLCVGVLPGSILPASQYIFSIHFFVERCVQRDDCMVLSNVSLFVTLVSSLSSLILLYFFPRFYFSLL